MSKPVIAIYPSAVELSTVRNDIQCPEGCSKTFKSPSNLDMHLTKHHHINPARPRLNSDSLAHFFCPAPKCKYSVTPFPKLKLLKQHYLKCHAEKKFKCEKCSKSFATPTMLSAHQKNCGKSFVCECGWTYGNKSALNLHCQRKNHSPKEDTSSTDVPGNKKDERSERETQYVISTHYVAAIALSELATKLVNKLNHKGVQTEVKKLRKHKATQETQTGILRSDTKIIKISMETQTISPYAKNKSLWKKSTETQTKDLTLLVTDNRQIVYDELFCESSNSNSSQKTDDVCWEPPKSFQLNDRLENDTPFNKLCNIETQTEIDSLLNSSGSTEEQFSFSTTETQTTGDFDDMLYNNTCTQTVDDVNDLFGFEFVDIETQTAWPVL